MMKTESTPCMINEIIDSTLKVDILYYLITNTIFIAVFLLLKVKINAIEKKRRGDLEIPKKDSISGYKSPMKKSVFTARVQARENLGTRFTIIRRIFFFVLFLIWVIVLIVPFLSKMSATVISLIVTVSSVVVGIAVRPYVENVISGIVISLSHNLNTGDTILMDGHYGTVEDITLSHTIIKIWDWRRYVVPNTEMLKKVYINYSLDKEDQWVYMRYWVSYNTDIDTVASLSIETAGTVPNRDSNEKPRFWVIGLDKNGVECWLAVWTKFYNAWSVRSDLGTELIKTFQKHNIETHIYNVYQGIVDHGTERHKATSR